jgi:hypothetical protein
MTPKHRFAVLLAATAAAAAPGTALAANRLDHTDRRAINALLDRFVPSAVARQEPAASWHLVTPSMRTDTTFRQWSRGDLPVYPYPARRIQFHGYTVDYALPRDVALELFVPPRRGARVDPISFSVEVKKIRGRWLVDSFYPAASFDSGSQRVVGPRDFTPGSVSSGGGSARLGAVWFAVPGVLLGGILLVPLTMFGVAWRRNRRAERAYAASRAS